MLYGILCAVICMGIYSAFLTIRGLVRLFKQREKKMFWWVLGFFVFAPVLLSLAINFWQGRWNIWIALPVLLFGLIWVCEGYFVESYLKQEQQRRLSGLKRVIPKRPEKIILKNLLIIGAALLIWCWGVFIGIDKPMVETVAVCLSMFLLARGLSSLWKYRGF